MNKSELLQKTTEWVEKHIAEFHEARIKKVKSIDLKEVLEAKNPYLFKAKAITLSQEFINILLEAKMSSSEETIFGNWLEGLAIYINSLVYNGMKSSADGIDLEFVRDGKRFLVVIKSGPNWGNQSQISKMYSNFNEAKKRISTSGNKEEIIFVNGCCYSRDAIPHKFPKKGPDYYKFCGQEFWEFISGDQNLYTDIIEPLGHQAVEMNKEYDIEYGALVNKITPEFQKEFCDEKGNINWNKIVELNSSIRVKKQATNKKAGTT